MEQWHFGSHDCNKRNYNNKKVIALWRDGINLFQGKKETTSFLFSQTSLQSIKALGETICGFSFSGFILLKCCDGHNCTRNLGIYIIRQKYMSVKYMSVYDRK